MHSVLIVDDEEPVLEGYGHMVETCTEGFKVAGKARSGYEAIMLLYELKPDVVFMDINMPGMDGLATIEEVHERFPDTVFILSTAYERFDLARRAIPLGVFRYLVKPVSKKDFTETLEAVRGVLEKRQSVPVVSADALVHRFLKEDVWKQMGDGRWQELRDGLGLDSSLGRIAFLGADADQERLFTGINASMALHYRFLFAMHLGLGMFFFPGEVAEGELDREFARLLADQVPAGTVTFVGVGSCRPGAELHLSCREALDLVNRLRDRTDVRLRERMRVGQLRRKMGLADFDEVYEIFRAYGDEVFRTYDFPLAKAKMVALFTLLLEDCTEASSSGAEPAPLFSPADEITPLAELSAWTDWAGSAIRNVYQCASHKRRAGLPVPLAKALAFLDANFDKQLQLSDAAEAACVSPAYLSRLFGDHLGSTFVDHLTVLRVERAEKLIRQHRLNIKEVAFQVGYQDPNYFSKIFRKIVGISPSIYAQGTPHEE